MGGGDSLSGENPALLAFSAAVFQTHECYAAAQVVLKKSGEFLWQCRNKAAVKNPSEPNLGGGCCSLKTLQ